MKIVFIGAGNLATNLAKELYSKSVNIVQVYSRTIESAKLLSKTVESDFTNNIKDINTEADLYIFSIKDSIIEEFLKDMPANKGLWVHTSGSIPMDIFKDFTENYGVIYPFQTFSKQRNVDFKNIPFFIEANKEANLTKLDNLCRQLSDKVYNLASEKRKYIHLTGVFACNFANHMYTITEGILKDQDIPFDLVLPLIEETTAKIHSLQPKDAQTGPAIRYDENIINKHLSLLENPLHKSIYTLISESIHESSKEKNKQK